MFPGSEVTFRVAEPVHPRWCHPPHVDLESEGQALRAGTGEFPENPAEKQLMHICFAR